MNEPGIDDYLITIIDAIGAVQAIFLAAALLYLPARHRGANRSLAGLMTVFGLTLAYDIVYQNDLALRIPHLIFAQLPLVFLYGPAFWLYLSRITAAPGESRQEREWLHFMPFAVAVLCYAPSLLLGNSELQQAIQYVEARRELAVDFSLSPSQAWLLHLTFVWRMPLAALQLCVYLVFAWRRLSRHRLRVSQHFSCTEKVSLDWVRYLLAMVVGLWSLMLLKEFVFDGLAAVWIGDMLVVAEVAFVFLLGLYALLQVPIFDRHEFLAESVPVAEEAAPGRYRNSMLDAGQLEEGARRLQALMESEKPYLDSELTLAALAARLGMPARQLSQIVNGHFGRNFLDFVNGYRVEAAKRRLDGFSNAPSILEVAMEVGFNSKSAFYNAFRRQTRMTPTQYRASRATAAKAAPPLPAGN